jgi:hypothetical protein
LEVLDQPHRFLAVARGCDKIAARIQHPLHQINCRWLIIDYMDKRQIAIFRVSPTSATAAPSPCLS